MKRPDKTSKNKKNVYQDKINKNDDVSNYS